jgi:4-hydroxy-tetrahydrodipicolinate synthase
MDRNSITWRGVMPALITPFDGQGKIDRQAFLDNIDRQFEAGATGILVGGCTG